MPKRLTDAETVPVMQAAGLEPLEPYPGRDAHWRCRCNTCRREVTPRFGSIRNGQGGCKYCAGKAVDPSEAEVRMAAAGLMPLEPYPGSQTPWRCQCESCDREVTPTYNSVDHGRGGCGFCAGNRIDPADAVADMRKAGLEPLDPYPGRHEPWRCRCATCGNEVSPRLGGIRHGQGGCRFCKGDKIRAALRLDATETHSAMEAAGLRPLEPYPGSMAPWRCECQTCKREVFPAYGSIRDGQGGCKYCSRNVVEPDEAANDMQNAGFKPLKPYPGSMEPWPCRCLDCGNEVTPRYSEVLRGTGCRACAKFHFNPIAPALIYLLIHEQLGAVKVGVTSTDSRSDRIQQHSRKGWELVGSWDVAYGRRAEEIEEEILSWWREEIGAPQAVEAESMRQGGATETAPLALISLTETATKIGRLVADT